jgi:hypothetical protein
VKVRRWLLGGVAVLALVAGVVVARWPDARPGDPAVWARIESTDDCRALQSIHNTARRNHERAEPGSEQSEARAAYAEATWDRMARRFCFVG